jgi:hypothetical protein
MDVLRGVGFQTDTTVISDDGPGLSADFGIVKLWASAHRQLLAEVVMISGVLSTSRSLGHIQFAMPRYVESAHFVTAWIVWHLDQHSEFRRIQNLPWVEGGRNHQALLPWVKSMAEWKARPQCVVKRDRLRLGLNTLAEHITALPDDAEIVFAFDGSIFSIRYDNKVIAFAAEGAPWTVSFKVRVGNLRGLPKRLMHDPAGVSIWDSRISIGNWTYAGNIEQSDLTDCKDIQ